MNKYHCLCRFSRRIGRTNGAAQMLPIRVTLSILVVTLLSTMLGAQQRQYLYSANGISNDVSAFEIDPATGSLKKVPGSPFLAGLIAHGVASDPKGQFLYVANSGESTV